MSGFPCFFWNNRFMLALCRDDIYRIQFNDLTITILLVCPAVVVHPAAVKGIIQYSGNELIGKRLLLPIGWHPYIRAVIQCVCDWRGRHIILLIQLINLTNYLRFFRNNNKFMVNTFISIRDSATCPAAIKRFLHFACHKLNRDILSFHLSNGRQNCKC